MVGFPDQVKYFCYRSHISVVANRNSYVTGSGITNHAFGTFNDFSIALVLLES